METWYVNAFVFVFVFVVHGYRNQKQPDKLCVCNCIWNKNFETTWGHPYNKLDSTLKHRWDDFELFLRQFGFDWGQSGGLSVNFRNFLQCTVDTALF